MSPSLKAVIPVVAGLMIAVSAQAQLLPTWETNIVLSQQDLDMIHGAVTNQVHGKPVGTAASWSNPASGNSGSIQLVKKLARKNQQCEDIEYTVRSGGTPIYTEHYHLTSCLQPDGSWKIA
jgi:surface antigen